MAEEPHAGEPIAPRVKVLEETVPYEFNSTFQVVQARLQYRRFDGQLSELVTRTNFARGTSVGVLVYDPVRDAVALVGQFRYPVYASLDATQREGQPVSRPGCLN